MRRYIYIFVIFIFAFTCKGIVNALDPNQENVCSRDVIIQESVLESYETSFTQTYYVTCYVIWQCTRTRRITKTLYRTVLKPSTQQEYHCCKGYGLVGAKCLPVCSNCVNGKCSLPEVCECEDGWRGDKCDSNCAVTHYGKNCLKECPCENYVSCGVDDGACKCLPGWRGLRCNETCPEDKYGHECSYKCICQNGGKCNHVNGYTGTLCEQICEEGFYGDQCKSECLCYNNATCDAFTGQCKCQPGFNGEMCENECPTGYTGKFCNESICPIEFYGPKCDKRCSCVWLNAKHCEPLSGSCLCKPGFTSSSKCKEKCPVGLYGEGCNEPCLCENGAWCDNTDGSCKCLPGFKGKLCKETCPVGTFGPNCAGSCKCYPWSICNPSNGECSCKEDDPDCQLSCPEGYWGESCQNKCNCLGSDTVFCHPVDGSCVCKSGWTKPPTCDKKCKVGYWGPYDCNFSCDCVNAEIGEASNTCGFRTGVCRCKTGWSGFYCTDPCPEGRYGKYCNNECGCLNGGSCNRFTGECSCRGGYSGDKCQLDCGNNKAKCYQSGAGKQTGDQESGAKTILIAIIIPVIVLGRISGERRPC